MSNRTSNRARNEFMRQPLSRRQFLRSASGAAYATLLAACVQPEAPAASSETTGAVDSESRTLRFSLVAGASEMPGWQGITDAWNEDHSDIMVDLEQLPGGWDEYVQKMTAQVAAGDPPDIGRMGVAYMPAFITNQQVIDLGPLADADSFPYEDYYERAFGPYRQGDSLWGMPIGIYTMASYINKTMFEEAGIELPSLDWENSWDWAQLREIALQLSSGEGVERQFGIYFYLVPEYMIHYVWQNGGSYLSEDKTQCLMNEAAAQEAISYMRDIMVEENAAPQPAQVQALPLSEMFRTGRLGILPVGQWMMGFMSEITDFEWGVLPMARQQEVATEIFADGYVVFKGAEQVEASWEVIKSFVGEKAENVLVDNNLAGIPVLKQVAEARQGDMFNPLPPEEKQVWLDSIQYARDLPYTPNWRELVEVTSEELELMALGEKSAEAACESITERINALLT